MIVVNIFQLPLPFTIGIIISENVHNYGQPLLAPANLTLMKKYMHIHKV